MTNATGTTLDLSPQEAEAVLELWAKKQAEGELRSRLNVQDLAEAMSLPVEEVEKMVDAVRQKTVDQNPTPPVKRAKPINRPLIALAVVVWFAILGGACFFAFKAGLSKGQATGGFPTMAAPPDIAEIIHLPGSTVVDTMAPAAVMAELNTPVHQIPQSVSLEFKGYKVYGEQRTNANENSILEALQQIVYEVSPGSSAKPEVVHSDIAIIDALQSSDASKIDGQIQFETMTLKGNGVSMSQKIPIAKVVDSNLIRLVTEEQRVRLKILANWAFNERGKDALTRP